MSNIALYIRLSKEDVKNEDESASVKNQRDLLSKFVIDKFGVFDFLEYVDDGFSGTSFDRPAFNRLIDAVEKKEVSTIIVKDLSRLGRNYIDSLHYIEQVFPLHNVKLIAVNDNLDTSNNSSSTSIETSFKALINSYYSKDLSKKVKIASKNKALKGEWLYEPFYGYKRSEVEKNKLEIDPESSNIVATIYKMFLEGVKMAEIARTLNDRGVLTPMQYNDKTQNIARSRWLNKNDKVFWTYNNVWRILKDEKYTGTLVHNKKEQVSVGSKSRRLLDKENWTIVRNVFEPIICQKDFDEVQRNIKNPNHKGTQKSNDPLLYKIVCGKCGHDLRKYNYKYKSKSIIKYNCQFHSTTSNELCFDGHIYREDIENVIVENIKIQIEIFSDLKKNIEINKKQYANEIAELLKKERDVSSELKRSKVKKSDLIEELIEDKISEDEFKKITEDIEKVINFVNGELDDIRMAMENIKAKLNSKKYEYVLDVLENVLELEDGLEEVIEFIDKIFVYEKDKIEIVFNFNDNLS